METHELIPDPRRPGWLVASIPAGELRVDAHWRDRLEELGLIDLDRWRREDLPGVTIERKGPRTPGAAPTEPIAWVRCFPGKDAALLAKYRRGVGRAEWIEQLFHRGRVLSEPSGERAKRVLARIGRTPPQLILIGAVKSKARLERESFLVSRETLDFEPLHRVPWDELGPRLRALLGALPPRRVATPDVCAR